MEKFKGKKLKMTQVYSGEKVVPVTPVKIDSGDLNLIKAGDYVKGSGTVKGRGFQGVVKRHGFHGGPATHGQKNRQRAPGSIGNTTPQRVLPGRKMAGHMGTNRATLTNVKVVEVRIDEKLVFIKGALPGNNGDKVELRTKN